MITATGNNFGAGEIVLKDYQRDHIIIFNGEVSFDPSNEAYRSVDVLEIYFPDLSLNKSSISGILMHGSASPRPRGSCIKTWIKDRNTVCVEKVTAWDDEEQITLCFACAYVPKGQHQTFEPMEWMKVYEMNKVGTVNTDQTYWTMCDDWAWITLTFNSLKQPDEDTYVSFDVRDFPEDLDFSGTMLFNEAISPSVGTEMAKFTIKGKTVTVLDKNMHHYSEQSCGFVVFIIRDHNDTKMKPIIQQRIFNPLIFTTMKYIPSIAFEEMSGSAKGVTAAKVRGRKYIRNRGYGGGFKTSAQAAVKSIFKQLSQSWKNLTNAQILAWNQLANTQKGKSVLGTSSKISGANLYSRLNFWIVKCGGAATATPPTLVGVDAPAEAEVDYGADAFTFQLTDMPESTENLKLVIMASAPQSNGVTKAYSKAVQIGAPREIVDAAIDIKAEYESVHGVANTAVPKVFMKYFFVNAVTGEKSGEMLVQATYSAPAGE